MKRRRSATGTKHNASCPMPIPEMRAMRFSNVETGVRDVVKRLVLIGAWPVWSCQGHWDSEQPGWLWYPGRKNKRLADIYVSWQRPVVICSGGLRECVRICDDTIWNRGKFYIVTALPVRIRRGSSYDAMRLAAPGRRGWFLLSFRERGVPT